MTDLQKAHCEAVDRAKTENQSVVQNWLRFRCTLRQQATLLSALRSCDGLSKEDPSKVITRAIRKLILISVDQDHMNDPNNTFMSFKLTVKPLDKFLDDLDKYPMHFIAHLMQALLLIGLKHPDYNERIIFHSLYCGICNRLHVKPEFPKDTDHRLRDGRRTELEERGARARI